MRMPPTQKWDKANCSSTTVSLRYPFSIGEIPIELGNNVLGLSNGWLRREKQREAER